MKTIDFTYFKENFLKEAFYFDLLKLAEKLNCSLYLVGGSIRCLLMKDYEKIMDLDFTSDNALKLAGLFARKTKGTFILLDGEEETARVVIRNRDKEFILDFSQIKGSNIEEDIYNRDFSINAIAVSFKDLYNDKIELIDPTGGKDDIKNRIIRVISDKSFTNDPLRMVRAFRFSAVLDFDITSDTFRLIRDERRKLNFVSKERIEAELFKMLEAQKSWKHLKDMYNTGLLEVIIPETGCLKKGHALFTTHKKLEEIIYGEYEEIFPKFFENITDYLNKADKKPLLKFGLLLTLSKECNSEISPVDICKKLKMSNHKTDTIMKLVNNHKFIEIFLKEKKETGSLRKNIILDFFRRSEIDGLGVILTGLSCKWKKEDNKLLYELLNYILHIYFHKIIPIQKSPRIINGLDLVNIFSLKPGPVFKKLLDMIEEKQVEGTINSREEAIEFIDNYLKKKSAQLSP